MLVSAPIPRNSRSRFEVASYGFDPDLCCLGSDPSGSIISAGLRVPTLATTSRATRYLFQLATVKLGKCPVWLVGIGQMLTLYTNTALGSGVPVAPVERFVRSDPSYHFTDATVSWHLRYLRSVPSYLRKHNVLETESFAWRWSGSSPALVFEDATFNAANLDGRGHPDNYVPLTGYTPPYGGQPPGVDVAGLGTFNSIEFPWDNPNAQAIEPVKLEGPGALVLYASVWQTNPGTRAVVQAPAAYPAPIDLGEAGFVLDFPGAVYGRIGGLLRLERAAA